MFEALMADCKLVKKAKVPTPASAAASATPKATPSKPTPKKPSVAAPSKADEYEYVCPTHKAK